MLSERIQLQCGRVRAEGQQERRAYRVQFVRAGRLRSQGGGQSEIEIPPEPLRAAVAAGKFDARASFLDHAGWFEHPSLRNLVGVTGEAGWNAAEGAVEGVIRLYDNPAAEALAPLLDGMAEDAARGRPVPDVGLSLAFYPRWEAPGDGNGHAGGPLRLAEIRHIESVDFVFEPAAGSRVTGRLAAQPDPGDTQTHPSTEPSSEPSSGGTSMENQQPNDREAFWQAALGESEAGGLIAGSDLPQASRERLSRGSYDSPEAAQAAIEAERAYLAALYEEQVIALGGRAPRGGGIQVGRSGLERLELAVQALIEGVRPPDGVQPLYGLRELYNLLSGDYEMHGVFRPERVQFANVNSSTLAGVVADALNKSIANEFQKYPRWWEPIVRVEDFSTLQQVKWITLGGVGELPTVAEGAAYTELTWDDRTETADFVKKGGFLGLTIEAIDKDDTGRLRAAPRALAQAAWLSLSKAISAIFTSNPTMSDGVALFHASHANLGSTALSYDAWDATRRAMRVQTDLHSGERLGVLTAPKFLLVPPDLEGTALQTLATEQEPGQAAYAENVYAEGDAHDARLDSARRRVIVVDLWSDAADWVAVADPKLYPALGLGFRYGRTPEVFSVASPTAGLMFTNDTLPVKVRFFFAAGPTDWRGLYKHVVA